MKKRYLSILLAFVLCLSLAPMAAFAASDETLAEPIEEPVEEPAEEPAEEATPVPAAVDEAVAAVQALIDALPTADTVAAEDYDAVQNAYDAYDALTPEQQGLVTGAEVFETLFGWFNEQVTALAEHTHSYTNGFCTVADCTAPYQPASLTDGVYQIGNAGQLYWFAAQVNSGNKSISAKLTENITVNPGTFDTNGNYTAAAVEALRSWTPIGENTPAYQYTGTFDGNGKTISGLYVNDTSSNYVGLFGYVDGGTIQNVNVTNSYFKGGGMAGSIASYMKGTIQNCSSSATVEGSTAAGGIVGLAWDNMGTFTLTNCHNTGKVTSQCFAGGLLGQCSSQSCTITNCSNSGAVQGGTLNGSASAGGVLGYFCSTAFNTCTLKNCYNTGTITCSGRAGGVIGWCDVKECTLDSCYNTGMVKGAGGSNQRVGGILGQASSFELTNCFNTGSVTGETSGADRNVCVGGFVGYFSGTKNTHTLTNCYNSGAVTGTGGEAQSVGAAFGMAYSGTCTITNCYYQSGTATAGAGACEETVTITGETTAKDAAAFHYGEVTWLLNGSTSEGDLVWKQTLNGTNLPGFTGGTVYSVTGGYANSADGPAVTPLQSVTASADKASYVYGDNVTLTATAVKTVASYAGTIAYQWYKEETSGGSTSWQEISGAASATYTVTGPDVGTYTYKCAATLDGYTMDSNVVTVTVGKKTLTDAYGAPTAKTLTYNAQEQPLILAPSVVLPEGASYLYSLDGQSWESDCSKLTGKNAGTYKVYWKVDGGTNYQDAADTTPVSVTISPRDIDPTSAVVTPYIRFGSNDPLTFNGKEQTPVFQLELRVRPESTPSGTIPDSLLETLTEGTDYTVTVTAQTDVGSYSATIEGKGNYKGSKTMTWSIEKADAPKLDDVAADRPCSKSGDQTVSLRELLPDGKVTEYEVGTLPQGVTDVSVDEQGRLHFTIDGLTQSDVGKTFTIPVTLKSQNYEDASVNVVVKITKQAATADRVQQPVKTGDEATPVLWIAVAIVAVAAVVILLVMQKKKK